MERSRNIADGFAKPVRFKTVIDIETGQPGVSIGKTLQVMQGLGVTLFVLPQSQRDNACRRLADLNHPPL